MTDMSGQAFPVNADMCHFGLTKREYFAAMAMQGMLSSLSVADNDDALGYDSISQCSVFYADALIEELNK